MMRHTTLRVGQQRLLHPRFEINADNRRCPVTTARPAEDRAHLLDVSLRGIRFVALMTTIADAIYAKRPASHRSPFDGLPGDDPALHHAPRDLNAPDLPLE